MRQKTAFTISEVHARILFALARFHYLTAKQVSRLFYPTLNDRNRHVQRKLKELVDAGYVLRLRALRTQQYGQDAHVFTLADSGRKFVQMAGHRVEAIFRPSRERDASKNTPFMEHRLATIDVMIAAVALCRDNPYVTCPDMRSERELKRGALKVDVPPRPGTEESVRRTAVIPDAWFQLWVAGTEEPNSVAIELDRGTEDQRAWRQKIAAYVVWATGPYKAAFETDNLTVAVVCPKDTTRQAVLMRWTRQELRARGHEGLSEIFLFTAACPVETKPEQFFFLPVWQQLDNTAVALLKKPAAVPVQESGVVYHSL